MHKKILTVVGITILFLGLAIQPSIAVNPKSSNNLVLINESDNNNLVEYIIQIVRTDEIIEHKVLLTEEEVNNLESLFGKIKTDLDNSESKEEATQIYNDVAESFRNFGLLPEDISVNEIKQLMMGSKRDLDNIRFKNEMKDVFENRLCFVAGKTTSTFLLGYLLLFTILYSIPFFAVAVFFENIRYYFDISEGSILDRILTVFSLIICLPFLPLLPLSILAISQFFLYEIPKLLGGIIILGNCHWEPPYNDVYEPAEGWIRTMGLNGKISYDGSFYGKLRRIPFITTSWYLGITGFTGVNIFNTKTDELFYLGFALHVKIDTRP